MPGPPSRANVQEQWGQQQGADVCGPCAGQQQGAMCGPCGGGNIHGGVPQQQQHGQQQGMPQYPQFGIAPAAAAVPQFQQRGMYFGGGDPNWNVEKCPEGRKCEDSGCKNYHSEAERRCKQYVNGCCETPQNAWCPGGLHVDIPNVRLSFAVNLGCAHTAIQYLKNLEEVVPINQRAQYVRVVVQHFAAIKLPLLKRFLMALPLVHEIGLLELPRDPNVMVILCDFVEQLSESNPRLRDVIFEDSCGIALVGAVDAVLAGSINSRRELHHESDAQEDVLICL